MSIINKLTKEELIKVYPTLMEPEDFEENETTVAFYCVKDNIPNYRCVRCGYKEFMFESEYCPNCKRKIL